MLSGVGLMSIRYARFVCFGGSAAKFRLARSLLPSGPEIGMHRRRHGIRHNFGTAVATPQYHTYRG